MTIAANKHITAEEFAAMPESVRGELVRGEIVEMPPPKPLHGRYANRFAFLLTKHVLPRELGEVMINDAGYVLARLPDIVRGPDVSFVRRDRVPNGQLPDSYFPGPPDLAVEVISPSDTIGDIDDKIDDYLAAGCPLVVILHPKRRTATLYRPAATPQIVREPEALDLSPIVDGFNCSLADVFGPAAS